MADDRDTSTAPIRLFTIGFARKDARHFFGTLIDAGVRRVMDIRLNNRSQLAGFTKQGDLEYFLAAIGQIGYSHLLELAPTAEILDDHRKRGGSWAEYERRFLGLIAQRRIEDRFTPASFDRSCLLCSEPMPDQCHRRLVAEYLRDQWGNLEIIHL